VLFFAIVLEPPPFETVKTNSLAQNRVPLSHDIEILLLNVLKTGELLKSLTTVTPKNQLKEK
jgi:hypothetical protein